MLQKLREDGPSLITWGFWIAALLIFFATIAIGFFIPLAEIIILKSEVVFLVLVLLGLAIECWRLTEELLDLKSARTISKNV